MARKAIRIIKWDEKALSSFEQALLWISEVSIQQAEGVELAILKRIDKIADNPEIYPPDKFKTNNTGGFRAFETHSYRVSYQYSETEIRIVQVRHVRQSPRLF